MGLLKSTNQKNGSSWKLLLFIILFILINIFIFLRSQNRVKPTIIIMHNQLPISIKRKSISIESQNHSIRCIIFISRRYGRLGNRMFIIATGYAFARFHSCHLYIPPWILNEMILTFILDLQSVILSESKFKSIKKNISRSMKRITKDIGCVYFPELMQPNGISSGTLFELKGYWQTYLHFANYSNELRENIFAPQPEVLEKVSKFFIKLYQENFNFIPQFSLESHQSFKNQLAKLNKTTWIGVHIRRTDFVDFHSVSSDEYLFNALAYYTLRYPNAHFIVASDDKSYCKNLFHSRSNIFLTPSTFSPGDDLITLSLCQHSIITGGTFGWWSAYLANGEVVHDTVYPTTCAKDKYYYPSWFKNDGDIILHKHTL